MPKPTVGLSRKPALALTSSECSGAGKAIAVAAGSGYIQHLAIPKTTLAGFDAPWMCALIEGEVE